MGMFRTPYGKGGVLSKEADEARKKLYKDIRPLELQRKEKRLLIACYFFQLPFLLIPGFFSKPALSHKLFLTLPYGMCIIQVLLTSVRFLGYLRKEGTVDGWTYQKSFVPLEGNVVLSFLFAGILLLFQGIYLLRGGRDGGLLGEVMVLALVLGFFISSILFWRKLKQSFSSWKMEEKTSYNE